MDDVVLTTKKALKDIEASTENSSLRDFFDAESRKKQALSSPAAPVAAPSKSEKPSVAIGTISIDASSPVGQAILNATDLLQATTGQYTRKF